MVSGRWRDVEKRVNISQEGEMMGSSEEKIGAGTRIRIRHPQKGPTFRFSPLLRLGFDDSPFRVIMSAPYPFANPQSNGSNTKPSVQHSRPSQPMASAQPGFYAQGSSSAPSTTSLLPPSARGQQAVQAAFAKGPKQSLRGTPSTSNLVRDRN